MSTSISLTDATHGPGAPREVGRVGRAHGVRGEVLVSLITDRLERVAPGARLLVGTQWRTVATSRPQQQRWLVRFDDVSDRNVAETLTGQLIFADPLPADPDDAEGLWVHDLIGSAVVDQAGVRHGVCIAVIDNPAHDILELDTGWLVPVAFVTGCVDGVVTIDPPDGLFE
jgi:16S rRNA processing protein RimM